MAEIQGKLNHHTIGFAHFAVVLSGVTFGGTS